MLARIDHKALNDDQSRAVHKLEILQGERAKITAPPRYLTGYYYVREEDDIMLHFEDTRIILSGEGDLKLTLPKMFV